MRTPPPPPRRELVTDEAIGDALRRSAEAVHEFGPAKAALEYLEHLLKRRRAVIFLKTDGSVKLREAVANADAECHALAEQLRDATARWEFLLAERKHSELMVSIWQSEGSNMRHMTQVR